jgi:hypothetical protein
MRTLIVTLMVVLGGLQTAPPPRNGAIEGRVIRTSNEAPVAGARVVLVPPPAPWPPASAGGLPPAQTPPTTAVIVGPQGATTVQVPIGQAVTADGLAALLGAAAANQIAVVTDDDGKFSFKDLAPGRYTLLATRDGYYGPLVNGNAPVQSTKTIEVESDKTAKADLGMVQGGVIHGMLRDPDGQPAVNYALVTARPNYMNGRLIWLFSGTRNTDDRGEYRMPFPPGQYYIGSTPRAPGPIANVQDAWMAVFHPGTTDINQAQPVTLKEGGDVVVNLDTPLKTWTPHKIFGTAISPLTNLVPNPTTGVIDRSVTNFVIIPHVLTFRDVPGVSSSTNIVAFSTKPTGEFEARNVEPGIYELYALVPDPTIRRVWSAHTTVEIRDKDVSGITLGLSSGSTLNGQITVNGNSTPPVNLEGIRISLQPLDLLPPQVTSVIGTIPVDASGKFSIPYVAEARYRLNIAGLPPTAYVSDIRLGGTNAFDDGFVFNERESQSTMRIDVNAAGEVVDGTVLGKGSMPAANATVALVPVSSRRQNPALYKTATTDTSGKFTLRGVAPGQYTIYAWESVLNGAWQNADFIAKNESHSKPVTVVAQGRATVQLELIPAEQ